MTTEDNGFFKHRGWVSSEFKSALRRNLQRGGFRLGASSITMQMTKNVLLTKEKTLSRKVQELFLVWYLEQMLPKERILELYFNAIEFGPRIYGIGAATRHYFGKKPSELTPLEAAFFSSIMPNPKRRYIQYCHGAPLAQWDKYIHRIMAKTHERGRLTDEEYAEWAVETLKFDRKEATFTEKQCLEWVKTMAPPKPEPEAPPDIDDAGGDGGAASAAEKKLRRLYAHGEQARRRARRHGQVGREQVGRDAQPVTCGRTAAWALTAAVAALSPAAAPGASSFDRWMANPYPVADGFSLPAGDGGTVHGGRHRQGGRGAAGGGDRAHRARRARQAARALALRAAVARRRARRTDRASRRRHRRGGPGRGAAVRHPVGRQAGARRRARSCARTRGCPTRRPRSSWC